MSVVLVQLWQPGAYGVGGTLISDANCTNGGFKIAPEQAGEGQVSQRIHVNAWTFTVSENANVQQCGG